MGNNRLKPIPKGFYLRDPADVARDLLGNFLVRRIRNHLLIGKIVETEAYYGRGDPASRAFKGKTRLCELMFGEVGKAFIYMVHGNWLLNVVAHPKGEVGAVLLRALEPIKGIEIMKKFRKTPEINSLTNGPGKLTQALNITKELNGVDLTSPSSTIFISKGEGENFEILSSHRIGVTEDLKKELRFFIKDNIFVSRKSFK